jgi:hypothetical protein
MNLINYIRYKKEILGILKYSFEEVKDYKYLTKTEKKIITNEKDFFLIKSML